MFVALAWDLRISVLRCIPLWSPSCSSAIQVSHISTAHSMTFTVCHIVANGKWFTGFFLIKSLGLVRNIVVIKPLLVLLNK